MIHNIRKIINIRRNYIQFVIQESLLDSLIPAVIPRAIDVIRNSCGALENTQTLAPNHGEQQQLL